MKTWLNIIIPLLIIWLVSTLNLPSWIGVIAFLYMAWKLTQKPLADLKLILEHYRDTINEIHEIKNKLLEMYYYDELTKNRKEDLIKRYTEFLNEKEGLSKRFAQIRAEFEVNKFGNFDVLEHMYNVKTDRYNLEELKENEFTSSKEFSDLFSTTTTDDEKNSYLNLYNLWNNEYFKKLLKNSTQEQIFIKEARYPYKVSHYWTYMWGKGTLYHLERLGIIKKTSEAQFYPSIPRLDPPIYVLNILDFNEIEKLLFKEKKDIPSKDWLHKQINAARTNWDYPSYKFDTKSNIKIFTQGYWQLIDIVYFDDEY